MTRYEAFIEKSWRDSGMTQLVVARIRSEGRAEIAFFLLDLWCLGVKNAFLAAATTEAEFREIVRERLPEEFRERFHPACAKKMIEGAIAYASTFGFAPHRDCRQARRALGGLEASDCPETFTFGRKGKPCYVQGPNDTPERTQRVLAMLAARCGKDGFNYLVTADDGAGEVDEEVDADIARDSLVRFFEGEPESAPTFFEFTGMITALQFCPTGLAPVHLMAKFWGPGGRTWKDREELNEFTEDLRAYWKYLAARVAACAAAPGDYPKVDPIDAFAEDFDETTEMARAIVLWARGIMRATREWPGAWGNALQRADLAPHWRLVQAWSDPVKPENVAIITAHGASTPEAERKKHLSLAVIALICALRPNSPAEDTDV